MKQSTQTIVKNDGTRQNDVMGQRREADVAARAAPSVVSVHNDLLVKSV